MYVKNFPYPSLSHVLGRSETKRVGDAYTAPSPVVSLQGTSILSALKKVWIPCKNPCIISHVGLGWAPSTFVSSRNDRAKQKSARPEDFMDEEDLQEIKDSRNLVDTTDEMDFMGGTQAEKQRKESADVENEYVLPSQSLTISNFLQLYSQYPPGFNASRSKGFGWCSNTQEDGMAYW